MEKMQGCSLSADLRGQCGQVCWYLLQTLNSIKSFSPNPALLTAFCRPGQRGTTGQLIFSKCEDPPATCECQIEPPKPSEKHAPICDYDH